MSRYLNEEAARSDRVDYAGQTVFEKGVIEWRVIVNIWQEK